MSAPRFKPTMRVDEVLAAHPHARWVFAAWHLGGCCACSAATEETLEQVATGYRIPLERLMADLNSLPNTD